MKGKEGPNDVRGVLWDDCSFRREVLGTLLPNLVIRTRA